MLRGTVNFQGRPTHTDLESAYVWKLSLAYIFNSLVVPVSASVMTYEGRQSWYGVGGLATEIISLQVRALCATSAPLTCRA